MMSSALGPVQTSIGIAAPPDRILGCFFDPADLTAWWGTARSVTTPRALGVFAVEWEPTEHRDEVLGRLGGVFHGTVLDVTPGLQFFVGDAYWLPPDTQPLGPMSLEVSCVGRLEGGQSTLRVRQSGFSLGDRWARYHRIVGDGWPRALESLRAHLTAAERTA